MAQTKTDKGMPRKNCPARMGKVKLRNAHWREIIERDEQGFPTKWRTEPVIQTVRCVTPRAQPLSVQRKAKRKIARRSLQINRAA